jgi:hypothetical protein
MGISPVDRTDNYASGWVRAHYPSDSRELDCADTMSVRLRVITKSTETPRTETEMASCILSAGCSPAFWKQRPEHNGQCSTYCIIKGFADFMVVSVQDAMVWAVLPRTPVHEYQSCG